MCSRSRVPATIDVPPWFHVGSFPMDEEFESGGLFAADAGAEERPTNRQRRMVPHVLPGSVGATPRRCGWRNRRGPLPSEHGHSCRSLCGAAEELGPT